MVISTPSGEKVLTVRRGITIFLSKVEVLDERDQLVGSFKQKLFSIGGKFAVRDPQDNELCTLKGKWTSWDFRFVRDDQELARVTKKWAGLGKELFTTADNYMLSIDASVGANDNLRLMVLGEIGRAHV